MCRCGSEWDSWQHQRTLSEAWAMRWRGNPGQLVPYRVWVKENFPNGRKGCVLVGDDGFLRTYGPDNDLGYVTPIEVKTNGRGLDDATRLTYHAFEAGRSTPAVLLTMFDGNVPGELAHYPDPCGCCGLPEPPTVATEMDLRLMTGRCAITVVDEAELIALLLQPLRLLDRLYGRRYDA